MPAITRENARELQQRATAARAKRKAERERLELSPDELKLSTSERYTRLCAIIAALDKRLVQELTRLKPDGQLVRDLAAARRTLEPTVNANGSSSESTKAEPPRPASALPDPVELPPKA